MNIYALLTAMFIIFKLLGIITLTWWQVFIPLYIYFGLNIIIIILELIIASKG